MERKYKGVKGRVRKRRKGKLRYTEEKENTGIVEEETKRRRKLRVWEAALKEGGRKRSKQEQRGRAENGAEARRKDCITKERSRGKAAAGGRCPHPKGENTALRNSDFSSSVLFCF